MARFNLGLVLLGKSSREKSLDQVAAVAAFDPQGRLLVLRRADGTGWNCPGGHLEPSETPAEGATRELKEETGLDGAGLTPLASAELDDGLTVHAFVATVAGTPTAAGDPDAEAAEFRWVDPQAFPKDLLAQWRNPDDVILQALGVQPHTLDNLRLAALRRTEGSGEPMGTQGAPPNLGPGLEGLTNAIKTEHKSIADHVTDRIAALEGRDLPALHFKRADELQNVPFDLDDEFLVHQNTRPGELPWRVTRFATSPEEGLVPVGHNQAETRAEAIRMAHDLGADIFAEPGLVKSEVLAKADEALTPLQTFRAAQREQANGISDIGKRLAMVKDPDADPAVLAEALKDRNLVVFTGATQNPRMPPEALREAWQQSFKNGRESELMKLAMAPRMPPDLLKEIVYHPALSREIQGKAAQNPNQDPATLAQIVQDFRSRGGRDNTGYVFAGAVANPSLPPGIADKIFRDPTHLWWERHLVLTNPNVSPEVLVEAVGVAQRDDDSTMGITAVQNPRFPADRLPWAMTVAPPPVRAEVIRRPDYPLDAQSMALAVGDDFPPVREAAVLKSVSSEVLGQLLRLPTPPPGFLDRANGRVTTKAGLIGEAESVDPQLQAEIMATEDPNLHLREAVVNRADATQQTIDAAVQSGRPTLIRAALYDQHAVRNPPRPVRPTPEALRNAYRAATEAVGESRDPVFPASEIQRLIARHPDAPPDVLAHAYRWPTNDPNLFEAALYNPNVPPKVLQATAKAMREAWGPPVARRSPSSPTVDEIQNVIQHPNFPPEDLPAFFDLPDTEGEATNDRGGDTSIPALARERYEQTPQGYDDAKKYPESVEVRPGTERLRHLRDQVATHAEGVHKKDLPPWAQQNLRHLLDAHGRLSASRLDEAIQAQPAVTYRVGHTTWTGLQRHSKTPSQVFQLQVTRDQLHQLSQAGVLGTFFRFSSLSHESAHPVTPHTLGWVRWTGGKRGVHVDEVQSDFAQGLGRVAREQARAAGHDPDEAEQRANEEFPPEHLRTIQKIVFQGRPPGEILHLAFRDHFRRRGWIGTPVATLTPEAQAPLHGLDPTRSLPRHFHQNYREAPERMGALPGAYGELKTQANPDLHGQPTLVDQVRKSCDCLGESLYKAIGGAADPKLIVQHNLSASNLRHAHRLGGLAAPSLAITHEDKPLTGFGEITLVAPQHLGDPERVPVFDADVYSPRHPRANYRTNGPGFAKLQEFMKPHWEPFRLDNGASYVGPQELEDKFERGGTEEVLNHHWLRAALARAYLTEKGRAPEVPLEDAPVRWGFSQAPPMQAFLDAHPGLRTPGPGQYLADDNPEVWKEFHGAYQAALRWEAQRLHAAAPEFDPDEYVRDHSDDLNQNQAHAYIRDAARIGRRVVDTGAYRDALLGAVGHPYDKTIPVDPDFEPWVRSKLEPLEDKPYFVTSGGARRAYNLQNVLKDMTRQIRGGERWTSLGASRALGATRFKTLQSIRRAASRRIVSEADFETHKNAMDDRFAALADALRRYHADPGGFRVLDGLATAIGESYKHGHYLSRELKQEFPNLPDTSPLHQKVARFASDLVTMPTTYFEAKPQRAVGIQEFTGAAIPHDTPPDVRDILRQHGLDVTEYDPHDDGKGSRDRARAEAIRTLVHRHGLHLTEAVFGEALAKAEVLAKMRGIPSFPKLGLRATPQTPLISSPLSLRVKTRAMVQEIGRRRAEAGLARYPSGSPQAEAKNLGHNARGFSIASPGSVQGLALHPVMQPPSWQNSIPIAGRDTQAHEDLHLLFNQVGAKYGQNARLYLAQRLLEAIPSQYRKALLHYANDFPNEVLPHEEPLAHLINYVNNMDRRQAFFDAMGNQLVPEYGLTTDDANAKFDQAMFRAHRHLLDAAQVADESWLGPSAEPSIRRGLSERVQRLVADLGRKMEAPDPEAQVLNTVREPENVLGWVQAGQTGPERVEKSELGEVHQTQSRDGRWKTGQPVEFAYVRNTDPAPDFGARFGQDLEPHGRYMLENESPGDPGRGWETGRHRFDNPLVLHLTLDQDIYGPQGWKARLSAAAGGRKGRSLSQFLRGLGHDGVVTIDSDGATREIVDLTGIPLRKADESEDLLVKAERVRNSHGELVWRERQALTGMHRNCGGDVWYVKDRLPGGGYQYLHICDVHGELPAPPDVKHGVVHLPQPISPEEMKQPWAQPASFWDRVADQEEPPPGPPHLKLVKVEWSPQTAIHVPTPEEPVWVGADGANVPAAGPDRLAWDRQYQAATEAAFRAHGGGARLVALRLPVASIETKPYVSPERYELYRAMVRAGERLPPVVVVQQGQGWGLLDGNHRLAAARDEGLTHVDALAVHTLRKTEWPTEGLAEDLVPLLNLGVKDGPYEDDDAPVGPLNLRPSDLRRAYDASPTLQAFRTIGAPEEFRQALTEPHFYNLCATALHDQESLGKTEDLALRKLALRGNVGPARLRLALEDPDPEIRALAAHHPGLTPELLRHYLGEPRPDLHLAFLDRPLGPQDLEPLLWSPSVEVRLRACRHPNVTPEQVERVLASGVPAEFRALVEAHPTETLTKADLDTWLAKAINPDHFRGIVRALDPEGRNLVDHRPQLRAHPKEHQPLVDTYHDEVLHNPKRVAPLRGAKGEGISAKNVFRAGEHRFMVKPYHERVIRRVQGWMKFPIQGWAEMTNQALYHAAGIGHLHQAVHVAEHEVVDSRWTYFSQGLVNPPTPSWKEPLLVIHMKPGAVPIRGWVPGEHGDPKTRWAMPPHIHSQAHQIALMDFLTDNRDRHGLNLMYVPGTPDVDVPTEPWWSVRWLQNLKGMDGSGDVGSFFQVLKPETRQWILDNRNIDEANEAGMPPEVVRDLMFQLDKVGALRTYRYEQTRPDFKDFRDQSQDQLLAIDNSRSFQYVGHLDPVKGIAAVKKGQSAQAAIRDFFVHGAMQRFGMWTDVKDNLGPTFEWWAQHRDPVVRAFQDQLQHIRDPHVRAHLTRNFMARVEVLDEIAQFKPENYDWNGGYPNAPIYHPDDRTQAEIDEKRVRQARANAEAEARKDQPMRRRQTLLKGI